MKIQSIEGFEVIDSRGNPTVATVGFPLESITSKPSID